jgi:HPt (histidine-containing phosphotransfer) domain-containing protein
MDSADSQVDWTAALETVGGNQSLLVELVEILFTEYPKLREQIREGIESASYKDLQRAAHTLKSSFRYFGESQIVRIALELENLGRQRELAGTTELYDQLAPAAELVLPQLRAYVDKHRDNDGE